MTILTSWVLGKNGLSIDRNTESAYNFIGEDLSGSAHPKFKFLFTASLMFRDDSRELNRKQGADVNLKTMKFSLKQATRPTITVNYADLNFYGYRSKVATQVDYGVITLTLYDDQTNTAHEIFSEYLRQLSPISRIPKEQAKILENLDSATIQTVGPLRNRHGILDHIRVSHHYLGPCGSTDQEKITYYDYLNPRLQTVILDDLDMSDSSPTTVTATFLYDSVNIRYDQKSI